MFLVVTELGTSAWNERVEAARQQPNESDVSVARVVAAAERGGRHGRSEPAAPKPEAAPQNIAVGYTSTFHLLPDEPDGARGCIPRVQSGSARRACQALLD